MKAVRILSGIAVLALLAGCASGPHDGEKWPQPSSPEVPAQPAAPAYQPPTQPMPQAAPPAPRPAPPPATAYHPMANDQCGAQTLQYLVGKPRTEIPVPLEPSTRRVVCSTCVATQEYRADRQTIVFDGDTGIIKSVTCG